MRFASLRDEQRAIVRSPGSVRTSYFPAPCEGSFIDDVLHQCLFWTADNASIIAAVSALSNDESRGFIGGIWQVRSVW
jgi:hypothetical protein